MVRLIDLLNNEYLQSIIIMSFSLLFAKLIHFILKTYVKRISAKTKSDLDDVLLEIITKPLYITTIIAGLYIALRFLSILSGYLNWINRIFFTMAVLIGAWVISKVLSTLASRWLRVQKGFEKTPKLVGKIIAVFVYIIAFLMILSYFNVQITPLIATLGVGGLAIGLALQNTLSNFFAGLHIISDKPIHVGDFIEIEGTNVAGYVDDIGWRSTRIRTLPNSIVIIPNSKLAESIIINDSLPEEDIALLVPCGVDYSSDLNKVEKITVDVAKKIQKTVPGAVKSFEPFIRYNEFGDSNVNFTMVLRVEKFVDKFLVMHEFIKELKDRYDKERIEISWPVRKIHNINAKR